ncbi:MAG: hypothetical protein JXR77_19460, partial [Lentisphaeria bacterium]|nr:hypothetical protein [Lentisphaeria bacterium]
ANPYRQLVLDRVGEFVLDAAFEEGVRLVEVASRLAAEFDLPLEDAKLGVVELVRELMLRDFVFLVRKG